MLKFYFNGAPNPNKVALFLEESGLPYELVPVDTRKGEQYTPAFLAVNPNAKTPALTDGDATSSTATPSCSISPRRPVSSFPRTRRPTRGQLLSWLMFVGTGIGPYSGQAVTSSTSRRRRCPMLIPLSLRSPAPLRHPRRPPRRGAPYARRHLHDRRHGGVGLARPSPFMLGTRWSKLPEPEAPARRDRRPPGGGAREALKEAHLQDRAGRRRAAHMFRHLKINAA